MIIEVTQEDITEGQVGHCHRCPVARAVLRATNNKYHISVTADRISLYRFDSFQDEDILHRIITPYQVMLFIKNFDYGRDAKPFAFELDIGPCVN